MTRHRKFAAWSTPAEQPVPIDRSTELALRAIDEASAACGPDAPMTLDDEYLGWIALVETLPCNRSGADKLWVHDLHDSSIAHFRSARR